MGAPYWVGADERGRRIVSDPASVPELHGAPHALGQMIGSVVPRSTFRAARFRPIQPLLVSVSSRFKLHGRRVFNVCGYCNARAKRTQSAPFLVRHSCYSTEPGPGGTMPRHWAARRLPTHRHARVSAYQSCELDPNISGPLDCLAVTAPCPHRVSGGCRGCGGFALYVHRWRFRGGIPFVSRC